LSKSVSCDRDAGQMTFFMAIHESASPFGLTDSVPGCMA
jgi:hypothetical protein